MYTHINVSGKGIEDNVKAYQYVSRYNIQRKGYDNGIMIDSDPCKMRLVN